MIGFCLIVSVSTPCSSGPSSSKDPASKERFPDVGMILEFSTMKRPSLSSDHDSRVLQRMRIDAELVHNEDESSNSKHEKISCPSHAPKSFSNPLLMLQGGNLGFEWHAVLDLWTIFETKAEFMRHSRPTSAFLNGFNCGV